MICDAMAINNHSELEEGKICIKPLDNAKFSKVDNKFIWEPAKWVKCTKCGMWHSNRVIPKWYLTDWKRTNDKRKKAGIILIRENCVWVVQSYQNCYGFPKGEKDSGESEKECAIREFKEETGKDISDINLDECETISHQLEDASYKYYIVRVPNNFVINTYPEDDVEITSFGWYDIYKLDDLKLSKVGKIIYKKLKDLKII